jgi:hypothetical protein
VGWGGRGKEEDAVRRAVWGGRSAAVPGGAANVVPLVPALARHDA